jgi:hypothetical protein
MTADVHSIEEGYATLRIAGVSVDERQVARCNSGTELLERQLAERTQEPANSDCYASGR